DRILGGPELRDSGPPQSIARSERHYDVRREGALVHVDADDLGLALLADLELDLDAVFAILELLGIGDSAKFRMERDRVAGTVDKGLQRRVLDGLMRKEIPLRLFGSKGALQDYSLHARHRNSALSYQHSQTAIYRLAAERDRVRKGGTRDRVVDESDVHRPGARARQSEGLEDQIKVSSTKLIAGGECYRQARKSGQREVRRHARLCEGNAVDLHRAQTGVRHRNTYLVGTCSILLNDCRWEVDRSRESQRGGARQRVPSQRNVDRGISRVAAGNREGARLRSRRGRREVDLVRQAGVGA